MVIHRYQLQHEPIVKQWFADHGVNLALFKYLSNDGIICYINNEPCAAVWVYFTTNSPTLFAEGLVVNPNIARDLRGKAIEEVINAVDNVAIANGYDFITLAWVKKPKLIDRLVDKGYVPLEGATSMIKGVV